MVKKKLFILIVFILCVPLFLSCSRSPIEKALKGKLKPINENIAVSNHCQSCHLHADFVPELHMIKMQKKYKASLVIGKSTRCLQCHDLELENIFSMEKRSTNISHGRILSVVPSEKEFREKIKPPKKIEAKEVKKQKKERSWYFFYLY